MGRPGNVGDVQLAYISGPATNPPTHSLYLGSATLPTLPPSLPFPPLTFLSDGVTKGAEMYSPCTSLINLTFLRPRGHGKEAVAAARTYSSAA